MSIMSAMRFMCLTASLLLALVISPAVAVAVQPRQRGGAPAFLRRRITAGTVGELAPLWRFDSGQKRISIPFGQRRSSPEARSSR